MTESLPAVSVTAVGVAALRAYESRRPDRLFDDPYAAAFAEAGRSALPAAGDGLGALFARQVAIRTRFYDDYLLAAGCPQVVVLAAGLDARAFRLAWAPGVRFFELDLPEVLAFKDEVLTAREAVPSCERVVVPADLRGDWAAALRAAGFDQRVPAAWLAEGLLVYLSREDAEELLSTVTELSAPGSRVSFEHRTAGTRNRLLRRAEATPGAERVTRLWQGGLGDRAPDWLRGHGWEPTVVSHAELAVKYDRPGDETLDGFLTAGYQSSTLR